MNIILERHEGRFNSGIVKLETEKRFHKVGTWVYDKRQSKFIGQFDGQKKRFFGNSQEGVEKRMLAFWLKNSTIKFPD